MYILCSTFLLSDRHLDHRAVDFFSRMDQNLGQTSNDVLAFRDTTSSVGAPPNFYTGTGKVVRFRRKTGICACRRAVDVSHEPWYTDSPGLCSGSSVGISRRSAAMGDHLSDCFSCRQGVRTTNRGLYLLILYVSHLGFTQLEWRLTFEIHIERMDIAH